MTLTIPVNRSHEHKSWHAFLRGGCWLCGYHCDDCPIGVATCKCKVSFTEEEADARLREENSGFSEFWREG